MPKKKKKKQKKKTNKTKKQKKKKTYKEVTLHSVCEVKKFGQVTIE